MNFRFTLPLNPRLASRRLPLTAGLVFIPTLLPPRSGDAVTAPGLIRKIRHLILTWCSGPQSAMSGWRVLSLLLLVVLASQASAGSNSPALPSVQATNPPVTTDGSGIAPPPMPSFSPVELFRNLLAMSMPERRQFLTNRPPENQKRLLSKIREYELLKPEERELRLRATELRWFLLPLMGTPSTNRQAQLDAIPAEIRTLVQERLREWDLLPPPFKKELLDNESAVRFFTEAEAGSAAQKTNLISNLSPTQREALESALARWQDMPEEQRLRVTRQFERYFGLSPKEKDRALKTLSEAERQQIEKTLKNFAALPPAQRSRAIRSFDKFASLSPEEKQLFLLNAERWEQMSPTERQSWRNLVNTLTMLPVPPARVAPRPPLPPSSIPRSASIPVGLATNL